MNHTRNPNDLFVHHEAITAALGDPDSGLGTFDVVETREGFVVYEQSVVVDTFGSLRSAVTAARKYADEFDRRLRAQRKRRQELIDISGTSVVVGTFITLPVSNLSPEVVSQLKGMGDGENDEKEPRGEIPQWVYDFIVSRHQYGFWLRQLVTPTPYKAPACLTRCLAVAKEHGAQWILFDDDNPS